MSDITREDATKWLTNLRDDCGRYQDMWHYAEALDQIIKLLDGDAVPVVLCKDCVSFRYSGMGGDNGITYCARLIMTEMQPTDFCSYGERKDDETD